MNTTSVTRKSFGEWLNEQANPQRFSALADNCLPWTIAATLICLAVGLYLGLWASPADYQQGETVRIMYIHVPAAWLCMFCYTVMTGSAIGTLVWKHPLADVAARAAAPIGAAFTLLALITGMLWGKPMWGTWWVWDARLTSVLILFIMYLGLMSLWRVVEPPSQAAKAAAVLIIAGFINIPIIKFSVDWWNTLHQPASVLRAEGSSIHASMLVPLLIMALGFTFLFVTLLLLRMKNEIAERRIARLESQLAIAELK